MSQISCIDVDKIKATFVTMRLLTDIETFLAGWIDKAIVV